MFIHHEGRAKANNDNAVQINRQTTTTLHRIYSVSEHAALLTPCTHNQMMLALRHK